MRTTWQLAFDCAHPTKLAEFWALALGYEPEAPPPGFATMAEWLTHQGVPEHEWDDGAGIIDPDRAGPSIYFHKVPEPKVVKNRLHIDVKVGGGRGKPHEQRWARVLEAKERLIAAGATVIREDWWNGRPDHIVMADPEGNEFDLV